MPNNSDKRSHEWLGSIKTIAIIAFSGAIFIIVVVWKYIAVFGDHISNIHTRWAQFGDFFGGVLNPIFGFLSLLAILATLVLQRQELSDSTRQLRKSADALDKQNVSHGKQTFENTLFKLMDRFSNVSAKVEEGQGPGRDGFKTLTICLQDDFNRESRHSTELERAQSAYGTFYKEHRATIGHYFRTLFHIFSFINNGSFSNDEDFEVRKSVNEFERQKYAKMVRAQLASHEVTLLFYNGIYGEGLEGFHSLIVKYALVKHMNEKDALHPSHMTFGNLYPAAAFGRIAS